MANLEVKDGAGADVYLKAAGAGSNADPYIPEQTVAGTVTASVANWPASQTVAGTVSIAAGENLIGLVGASDIVVTVTPTCDTSAYASGDLIFDSTEVAAAVRANGGHCVLHSVVVHDKADQGVAMTLVLLNANTDMGTLNSAPDPDDTEAGTIIGWIPVATSDYFDVGASDVACIRNIGLGLKAGAATTSIWIAGVNGTGTPTFGASDLVISLYFMRA